jgi:sec-independent protein translocase protein TatC
VATPLDQPEVKDEKEMSFLDHLEELRWHLVRAIIAIFVVSIVVFLAKDLVWNVIIFGPTRTDFVTWRLLCQMGEWIQSEALCIDDIPFIIQSRKMTGQFTMHITSSFLIGLIVSFPYVFWEIWRFIQPGLYPKEKQNSRGAVASVGILFAIGVCFGYFVMAPLSVNFLASYQVSELVANEFDITSYVSTVSMLVLGSGLLFQLPIIVFFLTKVGLVTPLLMRTYRKHAIVVILILGALLTPPDPLSQILISIPLFGLYEFSIFISGRVLKRQRKRELAKK